MEDYNKQAKSDINLKKGKTVDVIEKRECGKCMTITLLLSNLHNPVATLAGSDRLNEECSILFPV